jgi:hypothetical protein
MNEPTSTLHGSCLCGAVRFRIEPPTLWCAHCHCTMCQRAHGAAFVTWVGAAAGRAAVEGASLRWHRSSAEAERGFCATCGSMLFFRSSRWPGELHVARTSFDGAIDREPQAHVFWETHVPWFEVHDALPKKAGA